MKRKDQKFLDWLSFQPSSISGDFSEYHDGVGRNVACHVRTAENSGTGYKPLNSAVPMTNAEHHNTHFYGESFYHPKEWFIEKAKSYYADFLESGDCL